MKISSSVEVKVVQFHNFFPHMLTVTNPDGHVYIWHRANGTLIEKLATHGGSCVSDIAWNPANPGMFASGGDDKKVRM